jgi:hypothetical protein
MVERHARSTPLLVFVGIIVRNGRARESRDSRKTKHIFGNTLDGAGARERRKPQVQSSLAGMAEVAGHHKKALAGRMPSACNVPSVEHPYVQTLVIPTD